MTMPITNCQYDDIHIDFLVGVNNRGQSENCQERAGIIFITSNLLDGGPDCRINFVYGGRFCLFPIEINHFQQC
jgi:hypothetical protein